MLTIAAAPVTGKLACGITTDATCISHHQHPLRLPAAALGADARWHAQAGSTAAASAGYDIFDVRNNTRRTERLDRVNEIRQRVDASRAQDYPGTSSPPISSGWCCPIRRCSTNLSSRGRVDLDTIFADPIYARLIGDFEEINRKFDGKLREVVDGMQGSFLKAA